MKFLIVLLGLSWSFGILVAQWDDELNLADDREEEISLIDLNSWSICPNNWHRYRGQCYKWFGADGKESWLKAEKICRQNGGQLASIKNNLQSQLIHGITLCKNDYWIGLVNTEFEHGAFRDPTRGWSWMDDTSNNFTLLEVNDVIGYDCSFANTEGKWQNSYCSHIKKSWVCKKDFQHSNSTEQVIDTGKKCERGWVYYNGNCYQFSTSKSNYFHAQLNCRNERANMVTIQSQHEQEFLQAVRGCQNPFWIGLQLSRPCTISAYSTGIRNCWRWADLSNVTYINWAANMPQAARFNECVFSDGYWENTQCYAQRHFICKKKATN